MPHDEVSRTSLGAQPISQREAEIERLAGDNQPVATW